MSQVPSKMEEYAHALQQTGQIVKGARYICAGMAEVGSKTKYAVQLAQKAAVLLARNDGDVVAATFTTAMKEGQAWTTLAFCKNPAPNKEDWEYVRGIQKILDRRDGMPAAYMATEMLELATERCLGKLQASVNKMQSEIANESTERAYPPPHIYLKYLRSVQELPEDQAWHNHVKAFYLDFEVIAAPVVDAEKSWRLSRIVKRLRGMVWAGLLPYVASSERLQRQMHKLGKYGMYCTEIMTVVKKSWRLEFEVQLLHLDPADPPSIKYPPVIEIFNKCRNNEIFEDQGAVMVSPSAAIQLTVQNLAARFPLKSGLPQNQLVAQGNHPYSQSITLVGATHPTAILASLFAGKYPTILGIGCSKKICVGCAEYLGAMAMARQALIVASRASGAFIEGWRQPGPRQEPEEVEMVDFVLRRLMETAGRRVQGWKWEVEPDEMDREPEQPEVVEDVVMSDV
ncbi:MAG: hypothetical protein M1814_004015 [Vezdaea aestivalis]|nr:MAG: hypothetical protein M1814_004015 [Vezdaea aestivalis]